MSALHGILLLTAAILAGALNSVAGGGSFVSFPALVFTGVPPITANATSTVALWPGSAASVGAYRKELPREKWVLVPLVVASLVGGVLGAVLLLRTPQATFMRLIPYLFLGATLLFAFGRRLATLGRGLRATGHPTRRAALGGTLIQLAIAVYGGFFGGGIGILMLALLALMGMDNIHGMNAIKTILATCINGVAVTTFVIAGAVLWPQALLMVVGAILGGYGGAHYAQKVPPQMVRRFVIVVGSFMSVYFFLSR